MLRVQPQATCCCAICCAVCALFKPSFIADTVALAQPTNVKVRTTIWRLRPLNGTVRLHCSSRKVLSDCVSCLLKHTQALSRHVLRAQMHAGGPCCICTCQLPGTRLCRARSAARSCVLFCCKSVIYNSLSVLCAGFVSLFLFFSLSEANVVVVACCVTSQLLHWRNCCAAQPFCAASHERFSVLGHCA